MQENDYHYGMRRLLFLVWLGLWAGLLGTGCNPQPEACVRINSGPYLVGDLVRFTDCSVNASSYKWDLSASDSSILDDLELPTSLLATWEFNFPIPGEFEMELTVFSRNGNKSAEESASFTVYEPQIPVFNIESGPVLRPNGESWDSNIVGSQPDWFLRYSFDNGTSWFLKPALGTDSFEITVADFPLSFENELPQVQAWPNANVLLELVEASDTNYTFFEKIASWQYDYSRGSLVFLDDKDGQAFTENQEGFWLSIPFQGVIP